MSESQTNDDLLNAIIKLRGWILHGTILTRDGWVTKMSEKTKLDEWLESGKTTGDPDIDAWLKGMGTEERSDRHDKAMIRLINGDPEKAQWLADKLASDDARATTWLEERDKALAEKNSVSTNETNGFQFTDAQDGVGANNFQNKDHAPEFQAKYDVIAKRDDSLYVQDFSQTPYRTPYEELLAKVLTEGTRKSDRTGTGTRSLFGAQMRFDLSDRFPLITTKKLHWKSIVVELLWLLSGDTNTKYMTDEGVTIWNEWADENGDLGPVYGQQWRSWPISNSHNRGIDQIAEVIHSIKTNPDSRRHIVSAWNVAELKHMALPPCHAFFQFDVTDGKLSCQIYQRSADMFLGVPFNIASYALLTHIIADQTGLEVGDLVWTGGDVHIYENHIEQVELQLSRNARPFPVLRMENPTVNIDGYNWMDFYIDEYWPHPGIKGKVAI